MLIAARSEAGRNRHPRVRGGCTRPKLTVSRESKQYSGYWLAERMQLRLIRLAGVFLTRSTHAVYSQDYCRWVTLGDIIAVAPGHSCE